MLSDRVSNPGPLTYESGALPIALRGPARVVADMPHTSVLVHCNDIASTSIRRRFGVMCPLGSFYFDFINSKRLFPEAVLNGVFRRSCHS